MRDRYAIYRQRLARSRGFASVVVGLLVGLLMLTGCTAPAGTADPTNTGTGQATATESVRQLPPPTTVAPAYKPATDQGPAVNVPVPVLPDKAKEFSKEGLIAFTEYWYSTLGYAFETGDPQPMISISGPSCPSCEAMKEAVTAWHSEGRWISGGIMVVLSTETSFVPLEDGTYQVVAMVHQLKVKYFRGDKSLAQDNGDKPTVADILLASYGTNQWTAQNVSHIQGSKK